MKAPKIWNVNLTVSMKVKAPNQTKARELAVNRMNRRLMQFKL